VLFEEYPKVLLVVIVVAGAWLHVRGPLFHPLTRPIGSDDRT